MLKHNQDGASSVLIILSLSVLFVIALIFGVWAYSGRQHYKNDAQNLISSAVKTAVNQSIIEQNAQFTKQEQYPLNTYNGPQAYGSLVIQYPKSWSGYVDTTGTDTPFVGYFNPGVVPSISSQSSVFALSVQVLNQSYSDVVQSFQQTTGATSNAYALPKLPKVVGLEISGPVGQNQNQETIVVLPLRSNTLEIATYGTQYLDDFNNIILPNFSFSP
ncbi:MAG TPA: hypothetical protein VFN31_01880 [Candidatus Saccharimonadales bacterium]|nr:hypothetical protein [Candidatus Saccharimonadales bacterium]